MKRLLLSILILLPFAKGSAQNCHIISIDHFGANKSDQLSPLTYTNPDGSFQIGINTNSTSGSIPTNCAYPNTYNNAGVFKQYNSNYTSSLGYKCAPKGINFKYSTFYVYPQQNKDTIIIGVTTLDSGYDIAIERHDSAGGFLWNKRYGGSGAEILESVSQTSDGGFYILSETNSPDGDVIGHHGDDFVNDLWLLRLDNNGDKVWCKTLGGSFDETAGTIITAPDGGCYVFGGTASDDYDISDNHGYWDLVVFNLDSTGTIKWEKCYGGSNSEAIITSQAIKNGSGGFYIATNTTSTDGDIQRRSPVGMDYWLLNIDSVGHLTWENTFGGPENQYPYVICQNKDGSLWMGGLNSGGTVASGDEISNYYGGTDAWLVHSDSLGNLINQASFGTNNDDNLTMLYPLEDGTILAGGRYGSAWTFTTFSPLFPMTSEGQEDVFIARLSGATDNIKDPTILPENAWQVFPNPSNKEFVIKVLNPDLKISGYTLRDASGVQIQTGKLKTSIKINCENWKRGSYFVKIMDNKGNFSVRKIGLE